MLTEDYLMRMINLAVAAMMQAIGLRKAGEFTQAHQVVEQALEQLTGLRYELLQNLDEKALIGILTSQDHLDRDRTFLVADLFQEQGEIYQAQNQNQKALNSRKTALALFLEFAYSATPPDAQAVQKKVEYLIQVLQTHAIPFDTRYALFNYYEMVGRYADAAHELDQLIGAGQYQPELMQEKEEFYLRMHQLPESNLIRGGLTRAQVEPMLHPDDP